MKKKVAIYARVSTEHEAQISALENQVQYYDEILSKNPSWELYDRYIDEGITGTSFNKRKNFLRMMEDASNGKFDLIITREVSRFARNTVDTLQQTRILKTYGVEVWFTEDNIWTMNDEDGELRLSIMATLAQNESKKTSMRVKAGQKISFTNGVLYGNGNILGYDRVGKEYVINQEQAKTVRRIYELYMQGNGYRKIQFILESEGFKTATGKTRWQPGNIMRILSNSFYCGRIEYRKQYVPDYLTQKKINNKGEIERIIVKGNHPTIVSEEEFDMVQKIRDSHSIKKDGNKFGKNLADNVWVRKLKCSCGCTMNRRINYVSKKTGKKMYTFQCYEQLRTGTVNVRKNKGLSTDGVCTNKSFSQWKLEVQADFIFRKLLLNRQEIYDTALEMLNNAVTKDTGSADCIDKIEKNIVEIDKLNARIDSLLDMCSDGDISRETFRTKRDSTLSKIETLEKENKELKQHIENNESQDEINNRLSVLSTILNIKAFAKEEQIPDIIIEEFVREIVVEKNIFIWKLNGTVRNDDDVIIDLNKYDKKSSSMLDANYYTGSNQRKTLIKNPVSLGIYRIPKNYMKSVIEYYYSDYDFEFPKEIQVEIQLS